MIAPLYRQDSQVGPNLAYIEMNSEGQVTATCAPVPPRSFFPVLRWRISPYISHVALGRLLGRGSELLRELEAVHLGATRDAAGRVIHQNRSAQIAYRRVEDLLRARGEDSDDLVRIDDRR